MVGLENILGETGGGDYSVVCWQPGQVSPNHCHPHATEICFCFEGGGTMRMPGGNVAVTPGAFCVHLPGEVHEYVYGPQRSLLFRVRCGADMETRILTWPTNPDFAMSPADVAYLSAIQPTTEIRNGTPSDAAGSRSRTLKYLPR